MRIRTPSEIERSPVVHLPAQISELNSIRPLSDAVVNIVKKRWAEKRKGVLSAEVLAVVAESLVEILTERSSQGSARRLSLISVLASTEILPLERVMRGQAAEAVAERISTAEAAHLLGTSRPYVTMLCDAEKLGEIETTEGGHRRILRTAVEEYKSLLSQKYADARSPRQAGVDAGMYEHEDSHYTNLVLGQDAAKPRAPTKKASAKRAAK